MMRASVPMAALLWLAAGCTAPGGEPAEVPPQNEEPAATPPPVVRGEDAARAPADVSPSPRPADARAGDVASVVVDASPPADTAPIDPSGGVRTIMDVGYGGIRVISQDMGKTWKKVAQLSVAGGDDQNLLRAVAYGNGTWVVAGWRLFTSPDGLTWTERDGKRAVNCGLMEGAAFGNGTFVGTCGTSSILSKDGVTWTRGGSVGDTQGHTYVVFDGTKFAASGDSGKSFTSIDGKTWQPLPGITKVVLCNGQLRSASACPASFALDGVFLRDQWRGKIQRSTDGTAWTTVYTDASMNSGYRYGVGLMAPQN